MDDSNVAQDVHRLVLLHGRERAREMVDAKNRLLVDIAAEVLADDSQKIGISYTGFRLYPAHARTRKSLGEMTRKLSDTSSQ
jgi:hypothetical protein